MHLGLAALSAVVCLQRSRFAQPHRANARLAICSAQFSEYQNGAREIASCAFGCRRAGDPLAICLGLVFAETVSMLWIDPSRISPGVLGLTMLGLGVLGPLALFGTFRLLARDPPMGAMETGYFPPVASDSTIVPSRATVERAMLASAPMTSPGIGHGYVRDAPRSISSLASIVPTGESVAFNSPAASLARSPSAIPDIVSPPPTARLVPLSVVNGRTACGTNTCAPDEVCCNPACGICGAVGVACTRQDCGSASLPSSSVCGPNTCNVGDVCCNPSCGICARPDAECSQLRCADGPSVPFSQACGMNTCSVGLVCCDASCGLCGPIELCARLHC